MNLRRPLVIALAVMAAVIVVLALFISWVAATAGGLRFTVWAAARLAPAVIQIESPAGTLLGRAEFGRIRIAMPGRRIEAEDVVLQWQPRHMLDGLLLVDALEAGSLTIASRPDESPPEPPPDLGLPLAVRIDRFHIGRVALDTLTDQGTEPGRELTAVEGRFASDGRRHFLERLRLATARLAVEASATLDAHPPFGLDAGARITGEEAGHAFSIALRAGGSLEDVVLQIRSASGAVRVDGEASIASFASQPFRRARLTATGLDPAAWVEGAPHAELSVEATLLPLEGSGLRLSGEIAVGNAAPGRLDAKRVPLKRLRATLREEDGRLQITAFSAALVAGRIDGSALWADGRLDLQARLTGVDAAAWHGLAKKTSLAGEVKIQASATAQAVQADLRDPRFGLALDATRSAETIRIAQARLSSKGGRLAVKGEATPGRTYALEGQLADFDPSVFVDVPRARLNAGLTARGEIGEQTTVDLHFLLRESRFAGHPLAGQGDVVLRGQERARADVTLRAGDNRLDARGGLGEPKDELTVAIDAPRLEQVGLSGALRGEVVLSGRLTAPGARWQLESPRLALPGDRQLKALASSGRWLPESGDVQAALTVGSLALGDRQVSRLSATLQGRRDRHHLEGRAQVGEANRLTLAASGGLDAERIWTGQIETLVWEGPNAARLTRATRLEAGPGRVVLGPAAIAGADWQASIERLRWQDGRLETSGRFGGLPAALLPTQAAVSTTLRLGGEWNIDLGERAEGRVRVFRQSGDVVLREGGEGYALGLERLDLSADFSGQQVAVVVRGEGSRAGTLDGRLVAALRREEGGWALARQAPWQGRLTLDTPSIAWLSPLAGANVVLGGHLQANVDVGGTPASPATRGQVSGSGLSVRLLDYGLDLGGGRLALDFTPETARLQRLELISVATQHPRDRRVDFGRLTAQPGMLSAEGEMALKSGSGRIQLRAERLAVSELPDRWVMVSGTGDLRLADGKLAVEGELGVDAAYIELAQTDQPTLSPDVVVLGREKKQATTPVRLDLDLDLGRRFYFQGAGLNARLAGQLRLSADNRGQLRAHGSVRTVEGKFDAYGRELAIERGILNFQGQADNPGLNVLALRKNLSVEAGVEVTGTVKEPKVKLVSVPDVPDSEKLSWMVLGRPPSQNLGAQDADLLLSAAMALRGNQGKGPLDSVMQRLRLEELGISSGTLAGGGRFPSSHVAGSFNANGATAAEQIATVGKRIGSNTVLSYERSLTTAESILKLTIELTRRLSAVGRIGADNSIGLTYSLRFGGGERKSTGRTRTD